ncbi:MAG: hypothetical protein C4554_01640 [Dethiobacter sp.]|nr:MAG: hypothetical protein C4554_01640 [Dethiobacter sp.]
MVWGICHLQGMAFVSFLPTGRFIAFFRWLLGLINSSEEGGLLLLRLFFFFRASSSSTRSFRAESAANCSSWSATCSSKSSIFSC